MEDSEAFQGLWTTVSKDNRRTIVIKKYVMGSQLNEIQGKIVFWTKEKKNLGYAAGTIAALGLSAFFGFRPGSWFLLASPRCLVPCVFVRLWVLLRIC